MQICQRILQRRCGKQELRNPMRQIIEILCTLCPMEDIPEIVRLINDKEAWIYNISATNKRVDSQVEIL